VVNVDLDIPRWLKLVMAFIDRVGFPILAFLMMWGMCTWYMAKTNTTMETLVIKMTEWQTSTILFRTTTLEKMDSLRNEIVGNQKTICTSIDRLHDKIKN
jgi:hypothetical protein